LKAKFVIGERTGCKADPTQVEKDMRTSRNQSNERMFNCTEWRTKSQIKGFFSRLTASCRKEQGFRLQCSNAKNILCHLEVQFKSKDKKQILVDKLNNVISECECDATLYKLSHA
jgi:hypothetical protein